MNTSASSVERYTQIQGALKMPASVMAASIPLHSYVQKWKHYTAFSEPCVRLDSNEVYKRIIFFFGQIKIFVIYLGFFNWWVKKSQLQIGSIYGQFLPEKNR